MQRSPSSDPVGFEAPTTVEQLLDMARARGLDLVSDRPDLDQSGLDYVVLHARDHAGIPWILRAPRRADVFEASRVEGLALELLRGTLAVSVPDWRVHAPELIAYPRLSGTPAVTLDAASSVFPCHRTDSFK